jgi:transposase
MNMRSLPCDARHDRRVEVIPLREAGWTYDKIASRTGLSRTGVFGICKRHDACGADALRNAPNGHKVGEGRLLDPEQEALLVRLIAEHTPEQLALPDLLWTCAGVARLIEQRCGIHMLARTVRLYLSRWGYGPQSRLCAADEPSPGAFKQWLEEDYPGIVVRARDEGAEIRWGNEGGLREHEPLPPCAAGHGTAAHMEGSCLAVLSSVTNKGQRHWMDFSAAPDAQALIGFLHRLTRDSTHKLFLIHGNLRVHDDDAIAVWLAEHDESIEVFCLPGHGADGVAGRPHVARLAA